MSKREVRGRVPVEDALAEYERVKAILPPGSRVTVEDIRKPWLERPGGREATPSERRPGPQARALPGSSRKELEAIRDKLAADKQPHGYESIAKVAGIHASTVRRRFGKL